MIKYSTLVKACSFKTPKGLLYRVLLFSVSEFLSQYQ